MTIDELVKSINDPKVLDQIKKLNLAGEDLKKYLVSKGYKIDDKSIVEFSCFHQLL